MTKKEFCEKMIATGVFTEADAEKLEKWGFERIQKTDAEDKSESAGRVYVCESMIWCDRNSFNDIFTDVIGREISENEFLALDRLFNEEW